MPLGPEDVQNLVQAIQGLQQGNVNAVSIKLPEFWEDDPEVWFARVEAQFNTRGITNDGTKFDYIITSLGNSTASEVKAIILNPPAADKYDTIKKALTSAFSKSQAQKDSELLSLSGLGDKKPSALLRKIRSLNSDAETLRRAVFLNQLPSDVRSVLAGQNIDDLDELANAADRIMEVRSSSSSVCELNFDESCSAVYQKSRFMKGKAKDQRKNESFQCYYHLNFGSKARRCQPGCCHFGDFTKSSSSPVPNTSGNGQTGR